MDTWLQVACNRLQDHPVLKNPKDEEAKGAKETCQKYVWNLPNQPRAKKLAAEGKVKEGKRLAQEGKVEEAIAHCNC